MIPPTDTARDKHHRFPGAIIRHAVWLYYRFPLSYRDVPELWCERGIDVSPAALRPWGRKLGQAYAHRRRRRRPPPGAPWPRDAGFLTRIGPRHDLGRAVAQDENVRDLLGQRWRHPPAAQKCWRTLLQGFT